MNVILRGYKQPTSIVQIYVPTEVAPKDIKDQLFYNKMNQIITHLCKTVIIMGDFNSQIGKRNKYEDIILKYSSGKRNDNGHKTGKFCTPK